MPPPFHPLLSMSACTAAQHPAVRGSTAPNPFTSPAAAAYLQGQHKGSRQGRRADTATWTSQQQDSSSSESDSEWDDWEVLEAVLGRPRTASERRKFHRVWQDWQRASAAARSGVASGAGGRASSSSGGGSSGGGFSSRSGSWAGMWSDEEDGNGNSTYSAGNSAGPRWGKASWTWEDMQSDYSGTPGSASADYEAWYMPPPGSSGSRSRRAAAGGSGSAGDAWGWRTSWQGSAGGGWHTGWQNGGWQHGSWQHEGWHHSISSGAAAHLRLLGLESSWLSSRCGKALRCAFLAKAKAEHPDMHAAAGSSAAAAAKERFQRVTEAYEALLALVRP